MPVTLVVSVQKGKPVTRRYKRVTDFEYWDNYLSFCSNQNRLDEIERAWLRISPRDFGSLLSKVRFRNIFGATSKAIENNLQRPLPVDWHLDYVVHEFLIKPSGSSSPAEINVKTNAFRDYHATEISQENKLSCPPFFEPLKFDTKDQNATSLARVKRGLQDTHLFLAFPISEIFRIRGKDTRQNLLTRLFSWFQAELNIRVANPNPTRDKLSLTIELKEWKDGKNWGRVSGTSIRHKSWSFPGLKGEILLSSPQIRKCVQRFSIAWHNVGLRKLLLIAPPGSGKEVLVSLFQAARMIPKDWKKEIISTELKNQTALDRELWNLTPHLKEAISKRWERPILFVDEIHQAQPSERASLLRILESDEVVLSGSPEKVKIKQLIWFFAASEGRSELLAKREPADFWTRMDQIIEMAHPLAFSDPEDGFGDTREKVLTDYFWMFWRKAVEEESDSETDRVRKRILRRLLTDEAFRLALAFAKSVGSPLVELFSIRYIRGMANRIKGQAVLLALQMGPVKKQKLLEQLEQKMNAWTIEAFVDMVMAKRKEDV